MPRKKTKQRNYETETQTLLYANGCLVVLGLGLLRLLTRLAGDDLLAVISEVELGDDNVGRVDAEGNGGTVGLLAVDALDVDDPLLAVDLGDLALSALLRTTDDQDLVILANGSDRICCGWSEMECEMEKESENGSR